MPGLTRTVFEAARAYANGLEERFREDVLTIVLYIGNIGVVVEARSLEHSGAKRVQRVIGWDEIERALYDALRVGIDKTVREIGLPV